MQTDGRTDVTKLTVAFRNFAKAPRSYKPSVYERIKSKRVWKWNTDVLKTKINSTFLFKKSISTSQRYTQSRL